MNVVFTIVAKNYIGLAQVLERSVKAKYQVDFYIVVADELESEIINAYPFPDNLLVAKDIIGYDQQSWYELAFKYNLVEFCTAIKPSCFQYFFTEKKYERVIYADPDVYFFESPESIFNILQEKSILLTPHLLSMDVQFKGDYPDYLFLVNGTFNLGFIGISNTHKTIKFLDWWCNRLNDGCFFDFEKGMATDQKWINLLPAFFSTEELFISRHLGMNVAPWNFHERRIVQKDNRLYVAGDNDQQADPLIFVHFSGYDYKGFLQKKIGHKNESASIFPDYAIVFEEYAEALASGSFLIFFPLTYSYAFYKNGVQIMSIHRRMYRQLLEEGANYFNPFEVDTKSYYDLLNQKKLLDFSIVSADKSNNKNTPGFDQKIKWVQLFFLTVKKIIGIRRYSMMIRFFRRFFTEENQSFLLGKELKKKY